MKSSNKLIITWLVLMIAAVGWVIVEGVMFTIETWDVPVTPSMRFHAMWKSTCTLIAIFIFLTFVSARKK